MIPPFRISWFGFLSFIVGLSASAMESTPVEFQSDPSGVSIVSEDGKCLSVEMVAGQKSMACVPLPEMAGEGWYVLTGEYKTSGMEALGIFVLSVTHLESPPWVGFPAASEWVPFQVCFNVKEPSLQRQLAVVLNSEQMRAAKGGRVELRNVKLASYTLSSGEELLRNGDFSAGKIGELPALWTWGFHGRPGDYALVEDKSFQVGSKTLQIQSENKDAGCTVVGPALPLPAKGKLSFTAWVRSDNPDMSMRLYLFSAGYKWIKNLYSPVTEKWTKVALEADVPEDRQNSLFMPRIDVEGHGTVRVAGASLVWSDKEASTQLNSETVSSGRNLLPNPDMDLGFNNWSMDYYESYSQPFEMLKNQIQGEPCRVVPGEGVEGGFAMLVPPGTCLTSSCVPITPGKKYTVSVYLKATNPGDLVTVRFLDSGGHVYSLSCKDIPTNHWQRYSKTIVWDKPSMQKMAYARLDSENGTVLMDRVQVEEGSLTDYEAPAVMLGVLGREQVFAPGEKISGLSAQVVVRKGASVPANIEVKVKNAWAHTVAVAHQALAPSGERSLLPLKGLPSGRLGVFVIEVKAVDAAGNTLAQAQSRYAVVDAPAPAMLSNGLPLFGVGAEPVRIPLWSMAGEISLYERMGARLNRFFLESDRMTDPAYQKLFREQIKPFAEHGFSTIIANIGLPRDLLKTVENQQELSPETLHAWAAYLQKAIPPFKDQIRYWEIINEPNIGSELSKLPPKKYAALLHTAYDTIKEIDPSLLVVGFSLAAADFDYVRACMQLGAGKWMDLFSWHPYRESPDMPDVYADLNKMKELVKEGGFRGPTLNGEQYFGSNLTLFHNHDSEVKRRYILPEKDELWTTGRILQNFIHHAAAEVPWSVFAPGADVLKTGGQDGHFLYYVYGAYNAATRMLNNAGPGQPMPFNADARAFFFPKAEGGPLLAMYSLLPEFNGRMKLNAEKIVVWDMMGNKIASKVLTEEGLPMQVSPVYVRFPEGTTAKQIQTLLAQSDISGLGEPFHMKLTLLAEGHLGVALTNRMNKPVSGKVTIRDFPASWKFDAESVNFGPLAGGNTVVVPFNGQTPVTDMSEYKVSLLAAAQEKFTRQEARFAPLIAAKMRKPNIGGPMTQWTKWIDLGEDNLSRNYNAELLHTGPQDLSARLALGWDKKGFTMALIVTDDVAAFPPAGKLGDFTFDSLQIYFDQKNNAEAPGSPCDGDDVSYHISLTDGKPIAYLEKGQEGRYLGAANQSTGIDPDVQTWITRRGNQTLYQIWFPAKCLPTVSFTPGGSMGFSLLINDNDGKGRKQGLTLAPKGEDPWNKPFYYRTLIFRGTAN